MKNTKLTNGALIAMKQRTMSMMESIMAISEDKMSPSANLVLSVITLYVDTLEDQLGFHCDEFDESEVASNTNDEPLMETIERVKFQRGSTTEQLTEDIAFELNSIRSQCMQAVLRLKDNDGRLLALKLSCSLDSLLRNLEMAGFTDVRQHLVDPDVHEVSLSN